MPRFHVAVLGLLVLGCSAAVGGQAADDCVPPASVASNESTTRLVAGGRGVPPMETSSGAVVGGSTSERTLASGGRGVPLREETSNFGSGHAVTAPSSRLVAGPPDTPVRVECR